MKKLVTFAAVAAMFVASTFAVDFAFGARGDVNFGGVGTTAEGQFATQVAWAETMGTLGGATVKKGGNIGGGFGFYGNIGITEFGPFKFALQPELDFNFNNGYHIKLEANGQKLEMNAFTHTLDIPVIVNLTLPFADSFEFGFGAGPNLAIPLKADAVSKENGTTEKYSDDAKVKANVNLGWLLDANAKFVLNENIALGLDLRYNWDFGTTKFTYTYNGYSKIDTAFTRRFLSLALVGEYRL